MEKLFSVKTDNHHYQAQACVIWCFDDRFSKALSETTRKLGLKNYDLVKIAGGAKALCGLENSPEKEFVLNQIKTSIRLHGANKIILMNHSDCGAYGGLKNFENSKENEKKFLEQELLKAKDFLTNCLPREIAIETVFVDFEAVYRT